MSEDITILKALKDNKNIKHIYRKGKEINKIYKGTTLLWENKKI